MSKSSGAGAEAPADDGEHNIQRIACGDAETQSDAAADPVAHGVADQQKKSGPGLSRATKWDRANAGKAAGKSVDKVCIVASIMVQRPPYAVAYYLLSDIDLLCAYCRGVAAV